MKIPKILHTFWTGANPIPEKYMEWHKLFLKLHPDWKHFHWNDRNRFYLINQSEYDRVSQPEAKSDIFRLEAVWIYGGVYADLDFEWVNPLEMFVSNDTAFLGRTEDMINNAIMGFTPQHPFISSYIRAIPSSVSEYLNKGYNDPFNMTGPGLMMQLLRHHTEVRIVPPGVFYPVSRKRMSEWDNDWSNCCAKHEWGSFQKRYNKAA